MNRREFLKSIGYVAGASVIPLSLLPDPAPIDPIELENAKYPQLWVGDLGGLEASTSAAFWTEHA